MRISSFTIKNYKGFYDPQTLGLSPGFNIVVGQNNVGKTALLEALGLKFTAMFHKSLASLPRSTTPPNPTSVAMVTFSLGGEELKDILLGTGSFFVPVPATIQEPRNKGKEVLDQILTMNEVSFSVAFSSSSEGGQANIEMVSVPTHGLYEPMPSGDMGINFFEVTPTPDRTGFSFKEPKYYPPQNDFGFIVASVLRERIYSFRAERLNVGRCGFGTSAVLAPNASNLPEVLSVLHGSNPPRFRQFNSLVKEIFPSIFEISVRNVPNNNLEITVWTEDPALQREDLAIPLSESGTGIGQVLAILYVVLRSEFPRTIIIDEPNSFLHPAAARKLIGILRTQFAQHQYLVSTHSPEILRTANPATLSLIRWTDRKSTLESLDVNQISEVTKCLNEVGAKLSDVFGADQIAWVEGSTEEQCYPLILEKLGNRPLLGIAIVAVRNPSDLLGKRPSVAMIWEIYSKLSAGNALIPPAIAFVFDRERRTEEEMEDLRRRSGNRVHFMLRCMFENYLIDPVALAAVMADLPSFREIPVTQQQIEEWLISNGGKRDYIQDATERVDISNSEWLERVNGAKLLSDLFANLSNSREEYRKTVHSIKLTEWLIKRKPEALFELRDFLLKCLSEN